MVSFVLIFCILDGRTSSCGVFENMKAILTLFLLLFLGTFSSMNEWGGNLECAWCSLAWGGGSALSPPVRGAKVLSLICRLEDLKAAHKRLINAHHCTRVVKLATIVGRTEQSN